MNTGLSKAYSMHLRRILLMGVLILLIILSLMSSETSVLADEVSSKGNTTSIVSSDRSSSVGTPSDESSSAGAPSDESSSAGTPSDESSSAGAPSDESSSAGVPSDESSSAGTPSDESSSAGAPSDETTSLTLSIVNMIIDILPTIIAGVGLLMGWGYIHSMREKANSATFTYWTQISIRFTQIKNALEPNCNIINNLYSVSERHVWEGTVASSEKIKSFFELASETILFLKNAQDQMPAYIGWNKDYNIIITFLSDIIQYDIRDADSHFIIHSNSAFDDREQRYTEVIQALTNILNKIQQCQDIAERKMYRINPVNKIYKKHSNKNSNR